MKYQMTYLNDTNLTSLASQVTAHLNDGWDLHGTIQQVIDWTDFCSDGKPHRQYHAYVQAIIKMTRERSDDA